MRSLLGSIEGQRAEFIATFKRFGSKTPYKGPPIKTALLTNVRDRHGREWCDHVWFIVRKQFAALDLKEGDTVKFSAVVKRYWKGYRGHRDDDDLPAVSQDFKLAWPLSVEKVGESQPVETLPLFAL